ncbi:MAG: quinone-dependent dihydroorotate dehydrogenase [Crocinitomicaceae bacterium]|nr:quinone-dependent dihydroorotate dehydrogenase [Crocinitomicaceae bacterium]
MYSIIRYFLFLFDPEKVHYFTAKAIRNTLKIPGMKSLWRKMFCVDDKRLEKEVFGIKFKNPVGLGAGFDKDAKMFKDLDYCGFGFIEIGTVTPVGQPGNDKPRLFRLPEDKAIINRMGFNNEGVVAAAERLRGKSDQIIIGGNIGKNKVTANEDALSDYLICFEALYEVVDYFVVNVSSPNTPNLRALQEKEPLMDLLSALMKENDLKPKQKPILLKIAPDLTNEQLDDIIEIVQTTKIHGVIATNTTISRENLKTDASKVEQIGMGGLSGLPVRERSTEVIRYLSQKSNKAFPIIGIGGIHSAQDALDKLDAGADLIQLYTGFIYEGPKLIQEINKAILKKNKI